MAIAPPAVRAEPGRQMHFGAIQSPNFKSLSCTELQEDANNHNHKFNKLTQRVTSGLQL